MLRGGPHRAAGPGAFPPVLLAVLFALLTLLEGDPRLLLLLRESGGQCLAELHDASMSCRSVTSAPW